MSFAYEGGKKWADKQSLLEIEASQEKSCKNGAKLDFKVSHRVKVEGERKRDWDLEICSRFSSFLRPIYILYLRTSLDPGFLIF